MAKMPKKIERKWKKLYCIEEPNSTLIIDIHSYTYTSDGAYQLNSIESNIIFVFVMKY